MTRNMAMPSSRLCKCNDQEEGEQNEKTSIVVGEDSGRARVRGNVSAIARGSTEPDRGNHRLRREEKFYGPGDADQHYGVERQRSDGIGNNRSGGRRPADTGHLLQD